MDADAMRPQILTLAGQPRRAVALTLALLLALLTLAAATARPANAAKVTTGWVTGTVYFNKQETNDLTNIGFGGAGVVCGAVGLINVYAGAGCGLNIGALIAQAIRAKDRGICAKLKFTLTPPPLTAAWPDIYGGGYCS